MHLRTSLITFALVILSGVVVSYPHQANAAGQTCGSAIVASECFETSKTVDLKCHDDITTCGADERCCAVPAIGESGNKCFTQSEIDTNQKLKGGLDFLTESMLKGSVCIPIVNICPAKMVADAMNSFQTSVKTSLGLDAVGSAAYACSTGIPDPQYVNENNVVTDFGKCQCINPERNPANAIVKLCLQHVGQVPIAYARVQAKDAGWLTIFSQTRLNAVDRNSIPPFIPDSGSWSSMIAKLGVSSSRTDPVILERARVNFGKCVGCALSGGYPSAIGCLPLDNVGKFIAETVFGIGLSIAGAICLMCIIFSAIMLQTSQGSSEQVEKARKTLIQCLSGLVFIIFSIFILRFIGVNLLRIYGLS